MRMSICSSLNYKTNTGKQIFVSKKLIWFQKVSHCATSIHYVMSISIAINCIFLVADLNSTPFILSKLAYHDAYLMTHFTWWGLETNPLFRFNYNFRFNFNGVFKSKHAQNVWIIISWGVMRWAYKATIRLSYRANKNITFPCSATTSNCGFTRKDWQFSL